MKKKVNSKNNIPKFSVGGQTLTGAAAGAGTGAAIGSIIPGPGTAIGAGVGALVGGIGGYMQGKDAEKDAANDLANQKLAVAQNNFNANYKPQFASGYYSMAIGGIMPGTNAMVDNNEVVQTNGPINQLAQSNGGGQLEQTSNNTAVVNGANPNQTDGVQAQIEPGSRIFSDKIKSPNGKTYAELADRISKGKSRYEKLLEQDDSSQLQKKTAEKMIEKIDEELDVLFQEQEATKPQPIEQPQPVQQGEPMMANGGTVPGYYQGGGVNPYEPEQDVYEPDVERTLANYRMQQKYPNYTNYSDMFYGKEPTGQTSATNLNSPMVPNYSGIMPNTAMVPSVIQPQSVIPAVKPATTPIIKDRISGSGTTASAPDVLAKDRPGYKRDLYGNEYKVNALGLSDWQTEKGIYRGVGALAPAVNIGRGIFEKVDLLDPNAYGSNARITAPKMDVEPQVAEVRNASMANRKALGSMGSQAFLTGMNSVNANSDRSIAEIYSKKHNVDAENQMKADMYNAEANKGDAENRLRIEMINRAAKGAKDQMLTTGLSQASEMGQGLFKDESYNKSMQGVNSNYYLGPDGAWHVKDSSQKGSVATKDDSKSNPEKMIGLGVTPFADKTNNAVESKSTFDHKPVTASIKAKDNEIFGGKKGVWSKHISGNKEYNDYIAAKMKSKGISGDKYSKMTWGEIKKYLD